MTIQPIFIIKPHGSVKVKENYEGIFGLKCLEEYTYFISSFIVEGIINVIFVMKSLKNEKVLEDLLKVTLEQKDQYLEFIRACLNFFTTRNLDVFQFGAVEMPHEEFEKAVDVWANL